MTDIIEGYSPMLNSYTVTRGGEGQKIAQAHGMTYYNLAYAFQNRIAEPLYVKKNTAPYKYPRIVVFRDELPKTISGKIQRNKL